MGGVQRDRAGTGQGEDALHRFELGYCRTMTNTRGY